MQLTTTILTAAAASLTSPIALPSPSTVPSSTILTTAAVESLNASVNGSLHLENSPDKHLLGNYHSFSKTCTNIHGDFIDSIVWACCSNMNGGWSQNRFRLGQCLENRRGKLVARRDGRFWRTCQDCGFKDPDRATMYSCRCWPKPTAGVEHKLVDTEIDLVGTLSIDSFCLADECSMIPSWVTSGASWCALGSRRDSAKKSASPESIQAVRSIEGNGCKHSIMPAGVKFAGA